MASHSSANLDRLPTEILEQILFSTTDLPSIHHLVAASPAAPHVFEFARVGPKALDHALAESMSPHVVKLVRLVGLVRTATPGHPPASSLKDFVERYAQCQGGWDSSNPPSLARSLRGQSSRLVRGILLTARRICCLVRACLEYYRSRWSSVVPAHLTDGFAWGAGRVKPWRQNPLGKPFKPQPLGPACWMEEQRVMRGFRRLQLLIDLKLAAFEGRLDWALKDS